MSRTPYPKDYSYGIIPIFLDSHEHYFLLLKHNAGHWSFPKGHAEEGERPLETALRELKEETGIAECRVVENPIFSETYIVEPSASVHVDKRTEKTVYYYIGYVQNKAVTTDGSEITDYVWLPYSDAHNTITHTEAQELLKEINTFITRKNI